MTAHTLVISPGALNDLKKIYQYGTLNWGTSRASNYLDGLKNQFWTLAEHPQMGIEREVLFIGMRSLTIESHVIFYRSCKQKVEIFRVLHGRQDPQRHIK